MSHSHHHDDHHDHAPASFGLAFAIGILLNSGFVLGEFCYGLLINSVALMADAGHNLLDVFGLIAAWFAAYMAGKSPTARFTFGFKNSTILAALFNAVFLLVAVGAIGWEAVSRFFQPVPVPGTSVMVVAAIGILINGATALLFMRGRQDDINIRGAYLHMLSDALVSAGVVAAGALMIFTGCLWLDPLTSLAIGAVIVWSTWGMLRQSVALSMNAVPEKIDADAVREFLEKRKGVAGVHDLHIWPLGTTDVAMTAHLVMPGGHPGDQFMAAICEELEHHHQIGHVTLQIETDATGECATQCERKVA